MMNGQLGGYTSDISWLGRGARLVNDRRWGAAYRRPRTRAVSVPTVEASTSKGSKGSKGRVATVIALRASLTTPAPTSVSGSVSPCP